jgi:predicted nucleotidyltransferase
MGNIFNEDFKDFISALNSAKVEYILVGGYSVILHGYARTTGDMDIWVNKTADNYKKLLKAFAEFKMPVFDMTEENFLHHNEWDVFSFGRIPNRIDIMVRVKGLEFKEAYSKSKNYTIEKVKIRTIRLEDLIQTKKAAGRFKDLDDIEQLSK